MQEIEGNIWDHSAKKRWVVVTTNGNVRGDSAIMGRGIAEQAALRFPNLPALLGERIRRGGNRVYIFEEWKLITFPTKHNWRQKADLELIENSLRSLVRWTNAPTRKHGKFFLPRVGCGAGRLDWETQIKPLCEKYLDDRFVVVWKLD